MAASPPVRPAGDPRRAGRRGFTLIEISVVIALAALLAGVVIGVTLEGLSRAEGRAAGELIETGLMVASNEAMSRQEVTELVWVESGSTATLRVRTHRADPDAEGGERAADVEGPKWLWTGELPGHLRLEQDAEAERIGGNSDGADIGGTRNEPGVGRIERIALALPDGRVSARGAVRVVSGSGERVEFEIDATAGRVRARVIPDEETAPDDSADGLPGLPGAGGSPDAGAGGRA